MLLIYVKLKCVFFFFRVLERKSFYSSAFRSQPARPECWIPFGVILYFLKPFHASRGRQLAPATLREKRLAALKENRRTLHSLCSDQ